MKFQYVFIVLILISFFSCEDVIDVDVPTSEPRLVIDASINWIKGTTGNEQSIKLTLTAPFFDEEVPPANNAQVYITDENSNIFNFIEDGNSGIYLNSSFIPIINTEYLLTIVYKNETYTGTETLLAVPDIEFVEQNLEGGITGEETEIKAFFTDPINEENYYFFEFIPNIPVIKTLDTFKDEFVNGNLIFGFYVEEDLNPGDSVTIRNHGVSKRFYEFMYVLLQQTGDSGGPFETQPATVRGNCMNITNSSNYPLGYFRLSEVSEVIYTVLE
ncbi:DUF4249 domain-containing protein [Xanthomarina spongicola]|uniref:Uncharacterized protein DUF4249 n=1 Tax=Xanthomarina spongicola TaxID=570520 RepID=A0A316E9A6_9FLAO|nr:DUF4249 domain-containing protein [Xanthomarina spongicola]PWK19470.1 uncharacterized protein DUF4249 [Xanthomarina spongicola]